MRELGYIEGENFSFDFVNLGGQLDRYSDETRGLVGRKVDIILTSGPEVGLKSALEATNTIPIVMIAVDYDPLALGYVPSLARPGGNVTGLFFQQIDLTVKRLQLVKDAFPDLVAATVLWDRLSADQWLAVQRAGPSLGMRFTGIELGEPPHDFDRILAKAPADYRGALFVLSTPRVVASRADLAAAAIRYRMPSMFPLRIYVEAGALLSYGPSFDALYRRAAEYVDRIAKGARPADLPIEQPTKFELTINLQTAKALGLTIPQSILLRADEVIE